MNKNLYDRKAKLPDGLLKHLKQCFTSVDADNNTEGYNRNKEISDSGYVTYQQIKRIKNWFDGYGGKKEDAPFILNGENKMRDFVNSTLSGARQSLDTSSQIRQDTGMEKEFIAIPNANVNQNISQYDDKKSSIEKYDLQVTESLKRINNLMKKII